MSKNTSDLSSFNNSWYKPGGNIFSRVFWYFTNACFFKSSFPFSGIKISLLKMFGAKIGTGVTIKPHVSIKYPWRLIVADNVWIGESVWIDNLDNVNIESNVCISQGAFLLCGNHDYSKSSFDLVIKPITLKEGCWIGAKSIVCPGVIVGSHALLTVGSIATQNLDDYSIYQGNPAVKVKDRSIN